MGWIDTHAHLADPVLASQIESVLEKAALHRVDGAICVAVDAETSKSCFETANRFSGLRSSAGIHPNYAHQVQAGDWEAITALLSNPTVVALGETGLDLYWDDCPIDIQVQNFKKHWCLSRQYSLPVIIHMRECESEMLRVLEEEFSRGPLIGVMHSYSGSLATAQRCLEMGLHISFAGMLTYKKSDELRHVASNIPIGKVLIETDSPYLSPEPHRSKRPNTPANVVHTAKVLADCLGVSVETLMARTHENTKALFSRWE